MKTENENRQVISFRPRMESEATEAFYRAITELGIEKSELASRAFERGLQDAIDEIRREKLTEARKAIRRLSKPNFEFPGMPLITATA